MLLYRPLLTAYRQSPYLPVRRFLLREFAQPRLHAEPEEILEDIAQVREVSMVQVAERLAAEVALRERMLRLRLTTGDSARQTGGIWTYHAQHRAVISWAKSGTPGPALTSAAGSWLGPVALAMLKRASGASRATVLAALGDLGEDVALGPLADELVSGGMPAAAAVGLARLGGENAARALQSGVEVRGLANSASFLGVALRGLPDAATGLLEHMVKSPEADVREAAAWALGAQNPKKVRPLVDALRWETESFVRLNLLASLARLKLPDSLEIVRAFYAADETELVRTAAIRSAGALVDAGAPAFLESVLARGSAAERAEALQALVTLQVPGDPYLDEARRAAGSQQGRLKLLGLLALVVWAPHEAFERVRTIVSGQPSDEWFVATYALRYLDDSAAVKLLKRLCEASRGSELEEIAVDALARHIERPGVAEFLLQFSRGARPAIVERIMQDFARHLPQDDAMATAVVLRQMIDARPGPALAGPLLVALGSLGGPDDAGRALPHLEGDAAPFAIRALELLMADTAIPHLEALAHRTDAPAAGAAVTAMLRLGHAAAADELARFASGPDGPQLAAGPLVDGVLSVRQVRAIRRLALLHAALQDRSKVLASGPAAHTDVPVEHTDVSGPRPPSVDMPIPRSRPDFLEQFDKHQAEGGGLQLPRLTQVPAAGARARVYRELGRHLTGSPRRAPSGVRMLAGAIAVLVLTVFGVWAYLRTLTGR